MPDSDRNVLERLQSLDPAQGRVVRTPPGHEKGYWAGAPGVTFDPQTGVFWLVYRERRPRGVEPDRGAVVNIARSNDGATFAQAWTARKEQLGTTSIERSAIVKLTDGRWALYISYVDPADGRWRIDRTEADDPSAFDLDHVQPVLTATTIEAEGVKDPFVFRTDDRFHMIVSYATAAKESATAANMHATHDAYNTGLIRSCTGFATSADGRTWQWEGGILMPPDDGWDCYCTRIGTVWQADGRWMALYDGSADVSENYEERCGLAVGDNLQSFRSLTPHGPIWRNYPSLRYFDRVETGKGTLLYYEMAQPDGSHDLRVMEL